MRRHNLVVQAPGQVELVAEELPEVTEGKLLLETVTTGLSAGTELTFVKGDNPALHEQLDPELGLFLPTDQPSAYPVRRLGYMEVARVAQSRTAAFSVGDLVARSDWRDQTHRRSPA